MDPVAPYRQHAGYNTWMNRRLYAHCATLTDEERRRERGAFFGSIHRTLNHLLIADRVWMSRFTGDRERFTSRDASGAAIALRSLGDEIYGDLDQLRRERVATDADIEAFVSDLTAEQLAGTLTYRTTTGVAMEHPMWWALTHFFNHQTHHRGQVTTLLSQAGIDPGVTDLIAYIRNPATP
jgi:uncharacterized damage-inducible protein DinB